MSGESQRWIYDEILPPAANLFARTSKRFDVGEMSPPLSGHWSLAGLPEGDIQRAKQLDSTLERRLREVAIPPQFEASLHDMVKCWADDVNR